MPDIPELPQWSSADHGRIELSDDLESWKAFQETTQFFSFNHGLLALFAPPMLGESLLASAYLVARSMATLDHLPRFNETIFFIPPGPKAETARLRILQILEKQMRESGDQDFIPLLPYFWRVRFLINLDANTLLAAIRQAPQRTACFILATDLYRFADLIEEGDNEGLRHTRASRNDHVAKLIVDLYSAARELELTLIISCKPPPIEEINFGAEECDNFLAIRFPTESHDEMSIVHLPDLVSLFRNGGWQGIPAEDKATREASDHLGIALFRVFMEENGALLAWRAIEPQIGTITDAPGSWKLFAAQGALDAGNQEQSQQLLLAAIEAGVEAPEHLAIAYMIAERINLFDAADAIATLMRRDHPSHTSTLWTNFYYTFRHRQFDKALNIAEKLAAPLLSAQCRAFRSNSLDFNEFIAEAEKVGDTNQAILACAEEALFRRKYCRATTLARRIPAEDSHFEQACIVRLKALRTAFHKGIKAFFYEELKQLMRVIAVEPSRKSLRLELERLLDTVLEEPLVKKLLSVMLWELISRRSKLDELSLSASNGLSMAYDYTRGAQSDEEIAAFLESIAPSILENATQRLIVGQGTLPPEVHSQVGPSLVLFLSRQMDDEEIRADLQKSVLNLHVLNLVCDATGNPNAAYEAGLSLIEYHGSMGSAQEVRNIGDHMLQLWPSSQRPFFSWRVSLGWACLGEACLRTGNTMAALRYLCLGLLAHETPAFSVELLRRCYRQAARVCRTFRLKPFTLMCIDLEKRLLERTRASDESFYRLEVFKLQEEVFNGEGGQDYLEAFARADNLLEQNIESEIPVLLTLQASVLRIVTQENVSPLLVERFQQRISRLPQPLRDIVTATTVLTPTREEIAALIESLPDAQDYDYLAFQINPILPAILNALRSAEETVNKDLFFLAASALSQPTLGIRFAPISSSESGARPPTTLRWISSDDLMSGSIEEPERYSFRALTQISLEDLVRCLGAEEAVLILAGEPAAQPFEMLVTRDFTSSPHKNSNWSPIAFHYWLANYKSELRWSLPLGGIPGFDSLRPAVSEIRQFLKGLSLGSEISSPHLTLIPPAHLFGFTWNLCLTGAHFLTERTSVAIAPSSSWLVMARTVPWEGRTVRKAWMGSGRSQNTTLLGLRDRVAPALLGLDFDISDEDTPTSLANSEIVFVGAHGGTGEGNHFRSIGDDVSLFPPKQFARLLFGSGCVVLAVCSGGRSDRQDGSEETIGLVSHLFNVGVRCVIAPPWPLDIDVMKYWLPAFMRSLVDGMPTGQAAKEAQVTVRATLDHPCAWGQMHIYGDQMFALGR